MSFFKKYLLTPINLNSTGRKFYLIFFTIFSAFIFLNFFEPFGLYYDKSLSADVVFVELFVALLIAFVLLVVSQFGIRPLLKINNLNAFKAFLWFLFEGILVSSIWSMIELIEPDQTKPYIDIFIENTLAFYLIMFVPYFAFIIIIQIKDLLNEASTVLQETIKTEVDLIDESGVSRMVLKTDNILFIQSSDNYAEIYHLENDKPTKFLLRNSIKNLESSLINTGIIRCHRSFMVNTKKIEITKKTSAGFKLVLNGISDQTIPVSKSYTSEISKITENI